MKNFSLFLIILAGILIWQATDLLILQADAETLHPSSTKKSPTIRKQHSPYQLAPGNNASAIEENDLTDRMNEAIEEEKEQI